MQELDALLGVVVRVSSWTAGTGGVLLLVAYLAGEIIPNQEFERIAGRFQRAGLVVGGVSIAILAISLVGRRTIEA